ncbi:MAG: ABC transporter ATP-binding protein, partial [Zetaproteobacteria bacterium]|nr:ABC transporter ATP-binding protein [Zetaproteobacteria bacterium]
ILISHDRHLLRTVCDELLLVADGKVQAFDGDLDAYATWLIQDEDVEPVANEADHTGKKEQRKLNHDRRKQLKPLRDRVLKLEKNMEHLQQQTSDLAEQLANADLYSGDKNEKLKQLTHQHGLIQQELDDTEEAWMQASEDLERASDEG